MADANCVWTESTPPRLDLRTGTAQRHVARDARVAEEIAIHHADVLRGHRSTHYAGGGEYVRTREQCLAALTSEIASRHGIDAAQVAAAVGQRDQRLDAAVLLTFAVLFAIAADRAVRRLFERFADEPWPALIATTAAAVFMSVSGVIVGGLGSSIVEMIQVGDTHLSYRAYRLPWTQHWPALVAGALTLFSLTAIRQWRRRTDVRAVNQD